MSRVFAYDLPNDTVQYFLTVLFIDTLFNLWSIIILNNF